MLKLFLFLLILTKSYPQDDGFSCNSYSYLGPRELEQMPGNCTDIVGHVWVLSKETSYDEMMRVFKTVKNIFGCVSIRNTNYADLAFFGNLENVSCSQNKVQATPMTDGFYIYNNRNLTQLYLKNIQNIQVGADMKTGVEYVHQKFCFSEHEKAAISPNSSLRHCSEPYECSYLSSSKTDGSQIPENCSVINWIIVLKGNIKAQYMERLQSIKMLYGQLQIENNKQIETLNLTNLQLIVTDTYRGQDAIILTQNPKLKSIVLNENLAITGACQGINLDGDAVFKKEKVTLSPNLTYGATCCDCFSDYFSPVNW